MQERAGLSWLSSQYHRPSVGCWVWSCYLCVWRACSAGMFPTQTLCWWRLAVTYLSLEHWWVCIPNSPDLFQLICLSGKCSSLYFFLGKNMVQTHCSLSKNAGREAGQPYLLQVLGVRGRGRLESQEQADLQASAHLLHPLPFLLLAPSTPQISTRQRENLKGIPCVQKDMGVLSLACY